MDPRVIEILAVHAVIGVACLYFGFTLKARVRWFLLFAGGLELITVTYLGVSAMSDGHA